MKCDFCSREHSETELMFRSSVGACRINICSVCVMQFAAIVEAQRLSPALADGLVRAVNAAVAR